MRQIATIALLPFFVSLSSLCVAQASWVELIKQHPNVRVQQATIARQQWRVVELQAGRGVDVDLSTSGHVPMIENYSDDFTRASKQDPYVDLVLSVKHNLYDFGAEQALVDSESSTLVQQRLEYVAAFAEQTHALWQLGLKWQLASDSVALLNEGLLQSNQHISTLRNRFEAGVGTMSELRTQQLYSLDIDNQMAQWRSQQQQVSDSLTQEYQLAPAQLIAMWQPVKALLFTPDAPQTSNLRSAIASHHTQQALHKKMENLRALAKPQLLGEVNSTLYDVTHGVQNFNVSGQVVFSISVFDNGIVEAQTAGLTEQVRYQQDLLRQVVSKKSVEFNDLQIQLMRLEQQVQHNQTKQINITDQIVKLEIGLGYSHNNVDGLALLQQQLLQQQVDALAQANKRQELLLKQVFVTEQLVKQLQLGGLVSNEF
jgi:outer membrane protein TolC